MEAQGGSWRLMEAHGGSWRLMAAHGGSLRLMETHEHSLRLVEWNLDQTYQDFLSLMETGVYVSLSYRHSVWQNVMRDTVCPFLLKSNCFQMQFGKPKTINT